MCRKSSTSFSMEDPPEGGSMAPIKDRLRVDVVDSLRDEDGVVGPNGGDEGAGERI